jgi:hypothetical protein
MFQASAHQFVLAEACKKVEKERREGGRERLTE